MIFGGEQVELHLCHDPDCPSRAHELPGKPWHYHERPPRSAGEATA